MAKGSDLCCFLSRSPDRIATLSLYADYQEYKILMILSSLLLCQILLSLEEKNLEEYRLGIQ